MIKSNIEIYKNVKLWPDHKGISKPLGKVFLGELFFKYNERKEDGLK